MSKNVKFAIGLIGVAVGAFLAFGVFGIQSAFFDNEVAEGGPVFSSSGASDSTSDDSTSDDSTSDDIASSDDADPATADDDTSTTTVAAQTEAPEVPEIITVAQGQFIDLDHAGTGTAVVLTDGSDERFLRFEDDFAIDNGPDLNVYLVADVDADGDAGLFDDDFIDLGDLTGNIGSQNYAIPTNVDLDRYDTVVIWCVRFGVAFNAADLA